MVASMDLTSLSGSNLSDTSILFATLTILVSYPLDSRCEAIVLNPIGYISNTGVDGIRSLTGPASNLGTYNEQGKVAIPGRLEHWNSGKLGAWPHMEGE